MVRNIFFLIFLGLTLSFKTFQVPKGLEKLRFSQSCYLNKCFFWNGKSLKAPPRKIEPLKIQHFHFFSFSALPLFSKKQWKIHTTFPLDYSLHYFFTKQWSTALSYRGFGQWYRTFYRIGQLVRESESMLSFQGNGLDFGIYFNIKKFSAGLFSGTDFGGRVFIHTEYGAKSVYLDLNTATYGGIKGSLEF